MAKNGPKMAQNGQKWPKMAQKWPKMAQKWPKVAKNGLWWPLGAFGGGGIIVQIVWPLPTVSIPLRTNLQHNPKKKKTSLRLHHGHNLLQSVKRRKKKAYQTSPVAGAEA